MGTANHRVNVVRITEILKHPNADTLGLIQVEGYQCVVKLSDWKVGDLGIYIQPDSIVPEAPQYAFLWADVPPQEVIPEKKRRITVRRFRKEYSEGLLLPTNIFSEFLFPDEPQVGDDVAEFLGITHYEPPEDTGGIRMQYTQFWPRNKWSLKAWYYFFKKLMMGNPKYTGDNEKPPAVKPPEYDVEAYKNFVGAFTPEDVVVATEKIHGSNARFLWDGKRMYAGSRKLWKAPDSANVWRKCLEHNPWIEMWCRGHANYTLYGEVVPTQGGFDYGYRGGAVGFFVFDIRTPEGTWVSAGQARESTGNQLQWVPLLYQGVFDEAKLKGLAAGRSTVVGATGIREGVVIKLLTEQPERIVRGLGRLQLKIINNEYYERS